MNKRSDTTEATSIAKHKSLYAALAAAQAEMGRALKDTNNPHFKSKYADLASVMDACMPALNRHGIAVIQPAWDDEAGNRYIKTILVHGETGDRAECRVPLVVNKNDMQGYGSAVTYARRYGLMGMAGIAPDDDDGNAAAQAAPPRRERTDPQPPQHDAAESRAENLVKAANYIRGAESREDLNRRWENLRKRDASVIEDPDVIKSMTETKGSLETTSTGFPDSGHAAGYEAGAPAQRESAVPGDEIPY